ncbi:MAG: hypothetical protein QG641_1830, partial [Candidatus Poribacteria bacterium]|nr:hypothetical protein [Candidatus Poribacteria bacterium]
MREWPIRAVSKTAVRVTAPWVQIPLPPPLLKDEGGRMKDEGGRRNTESGKQKVENIKWKKEGGIQKDETFRIWRMKRNG